MSIEIVKFKIEGMTCAHCATGIARRFEGKDGILSKEVDYSSGEGQFEFDSSKMAKDEVIEIVERDGNYKVTGEMEAGSNGRRSYDLVIIGGGSAAFAAAIKADELGKRTLMVNGDLPTGGTCVNVGCVPSKFLIRAAEQAYLSSHSNFSGIHPQPAILNFREIISEKKALVEGMRKKKYLNIAAGIRNLDLIEGMASFVSPNEVTVNGRGYKANHFLIATGSTTSVPEIPGLANSGYLTTDSLFDLEEKPASLVIIGAGYIGLEVAQAYSRLGCKVTIIQRSEHVLSSQLQDIAEELEKQFEAEGITIFKSTVVEAVERQGKKVNLRIKTENGSQGISCSHLLLASGRTANTFSLSLHLAGVELLENRFVRTNSKQQTTADHIYAAGDCIASPAYVYTAAYEGQLATINMFAEEQTSADMYGLPWVVFTDPQVAGVGMDESVAETAGIPYEVRVLPLSEVPRAIVANDTRGFIKLIRNPETDLLLGARMVGAGAGELVMQASLAMRHGITVSALATAFHPYLTLSEGIKLAAITFHKDVSKLSCCAV